MVEVLHKKYEGVWLNQISHNCQYPKQIKSVLPTNFQIMSFWVVCVWHRRDTFQPLLCLVTLFLVKALSDAEVTDLNKASFLQHLVWIGSKISRLIYNQLPFQAPRSEIQRTHRNRTIKDVKTYHQSRINIICYFNWFLLSIESEEYTWIQLWVVHPVQIDGPIDGPCLLQENNKKPLVSLTDVILGNFPKYQPLLALPTKLLYNCHWLYII